MFIGSTYKMTEMIARYSLFCYNYKITEQKSVNSIKNCPKIESSTYQVNFGIIWKQKQKNAK